MNMVEKVARALCEKVCGNDPDKVFVLRNVGPKPGWWLYIDDARIAIEAMREPTEIMVDAVGEYTEPDGYIDYEVSWTIMIDAALKETD